MFCCIKFIAGVTSISKIIFSVIIIRTWNMLEVVSSRAEKVLIRGLTHTTERIHRSRVIIKWDYIILWYCIWQPNFLFWSAISPFVFQFRQRIVEPFCFVSVCSISYYHVNVPSYDVLCKRTSLFKSTIFSFQNLISLRSLNWVLLLKQVSIQEKCYNSNFVKKYLPRLIQDGFSWFSLNQF